MDNNEMLVKIMEKLDAMDSKIEAMDNRLERVELEVRSLSDKMGKGFAATRSEVVEAVEAVGHKVDALEGKVTDVETVTARNTFELQLIKGKA